MKRTSLSRRHFIEKSIYTGATFLGVSVLLSACGNPSREQSGDSNVSTALESGGEKNQCEDFSGVSEAELAKRKQFGYVEETSIPESKCNNCQLWIMPKEDQACGGCMLFKGPVYDDAYCTYWAPQV